MGSSPVSNEPAPHGGQSEPRNEPVARLKSSTFLICTGGGLALLAIASILQGLPFGFAKITWYSLGAAFAFGVGATYLALYLVRKKLLKLGRELDLEFIQRTRELRNSEERFRHYAEVSGDWFWETDAEDRFVFFSSHLFEATGARPEDLIGKSRQDLRIESSDENENIRWDKHLQCVQQRLPFTDFDYRARIPNGRELVIRASGKPYFDSEGEFSGYRGSALDVTDTLEEWQSQKRVHDLIYTATSLLNDGFLLFDADDRLMICNDRYRQLYAEIEDKLEPGVTFAEIAHAYADTLTFDSAEAKEMSIEILPQLSISKQTTVTGFASSTRSSPAVGLWVYGWISPSPRVLRKNWDRRSVLVRSAVFAGMSRIGDWFPALTNLRVFLADRSKSYWK
jgi:PAS domain S-box-containing protein